MKRKYIEENLELIGDDFLSAFVESLVAKDIEKTLKNLSFLREKSLDVRLFLEQLLFFLRDRMKESLKKIEFSAYSGLFEVFEGVHGRLKFAPDPFLLLETSVFRSIAASHSIVRVEVQSTSVPEKKEAKTPAPAVKQEEKPAVPAPVVETVSVPLKTSSGSFDFSRFVEHIRSVPKRSFVGLGLRVSTYSEEGDTIVIHPDNDFNLKKLDSADVRLFLQETLDTLFGEGYRIDIRKSGARSPVKKAPSLADEASDIF